MLPSKYIISESDRSTTARSNAHRQQQLHPPPPLPLGITGVICTSQMIDLPNQRGKLHCTVYRPRMLEQASPLKSVSTTTSSDISRNTKPSPTFHNHVLPKLPKPNPPLICVAGGPGMSCHYLTGLVHLIPDRAIIIYDHYNCGQSTNTFSGDRDNTTAVSSQNSNATAAVDDAVNVNENEDKDGKRCSFLNDTVSDLAILIEAIVPSNTSFHLFGHSMGGIIVFEYLKSRNIRRNYCKSCILASTPTNIAASYQSKEELISSIMKELNENGYQQIKKMPINDDDNDESEMDDHSNDNEDDGDEQQLRQAAHLVFQQRHECRTVPMPSALQQSLSGLKNGPHHRSTKRNNKQDERHSHGATGDKHPASFYEYRAAPSTSTTFIERQLPPALIVRGQFDFVSEANCRYWEDIYQLCGPENRCQYITISDCSHYGFLEQENLYGTVVLSFLHDHDGNSNQKRVDYV